MPEKPALVVRPQVVADVLAAAHLSYRVLSPFRERGGIFFVSYPQMLKSTLIRTLRQFPDARVLSDMNAQKMGDMKDAVAQGRVRTVAFDEYNKLYQRNPQTAANLEGMIMAVVAQGWSGPSFTDQDVPADDARCLVVGGLTKSIHDDRMKEWKASGFAHRFLWCYYKLRNPQVVGDAIESQELLDIAGEPWAQSFSEIPYILEVDHRKEIRRWVQGQPGGDGIPYSLLLKVAVVLRWHYEHSSRTRGSNLHMKVLREFRHMLGTEYAVLDIVDKEGR